MTKESSRLKTFFTSTCIAVLLLGRPSSARAQEAEPEWSLGAGVAATAIVPYGGLVPFGTLSLERAVSDRAALIVAAGGTYQRSDGDFDDSKLAFARLGVGARGFLGSKGRVRPSGYFTLHGEYAYLNEDLAGMSAELGASLDASISDSVTFRIGAGLVRLAHNQNFRGRSQQTLIAGVLPQVELRAVF